MKFPLYWNRAYNERRTVVARGWSDSSMEEATHNAQMRLGRILTWLRSRGGVDLDRYTYVVDDVICEEVIDRIEHHDRETAVVSRNAYGALILNAANMMFVDIDFPKPQRLGCFASLFVKPKPPERTPEQETFDRIGRWQSEHPEVTLRVYRTAAGVRLIVANQCFETVDEYASEMLRSLGCDTLYIQLCQSQNCFRARLSPKPWRVGMQKPPKLFPFESSSDQAAFEKWYQEYVASTKSFQVCKFIETIGSGEIHERHTELIQMHDNLCCGKDDLPLA